MSEQSRETIEGEVVETTQPVGAPLVPIEAHHAVTPMAMLDRALSRGASVEVLEKLMALQERHDKNQARKAFDDAMASAKSEIPPIVKNRRVGFDSKKQGAARTDYKHEDLGEIARTVDPILAKYGLSYRWRTDAVPNQPITVTCIVSHRFGHSEENTLSAGRDDSGNKNSIQAIGSTITYLQRYTLKAALGLAASNDDDGAADAGDVLSDDQLAQITQWILDTQSNVNLFCKVMKVECLPDIPASRFKEAKERLAAKAKQMGVALKQPEATS